MSKRVSYTPPESPRERVALTKKLMAFYRDEVNAGATITTEMIEAAIACGFDRSKTARVATTEANDLN